MKSKNVNTIKEITSPTKLSANDMTSSFLIGNLGLKSSAVGEGVFWTNWAKDPIHQTKTHVHNA